MIKDRIAVYMNSGKSHFAANLDFSKSAYIICTNFKCFIGSEPLSEKRNTFRVIANGRNGKRNLKTFPITIQDFSLEQVK